MIDDKYLRGRLYGVAIYESENAPIVGVDAVLSRLKAVGGGYEAVHPQDIKIVPVIRDLVEDYLDTFAAERFGVPATAVNRVRILKVCFKA